MVLPPNTQAQLSHAITIRVNGIIIGAINSWNPRIDRTITELYELNGGSPFSGADGNMGNGEPFEKVPGNVSGMTIEVQRYDLYTLQMEQAFGTPDLSMLSTQVSSFIVRETWVKPNNANNYFYEYRGCWFSNIGRTIQSTGDRIVNVNATLHYTRRERGAA